MKSYKKLPTIRYFAVCSYKNELKQLLYIT
jgi:hypothetical protein